MRSPAETRWLWRFAGFAALLTFLPYLIAFSRAGEAWEFTGFLFGVDDGNSYIAKMLAGAQGAWLFRTPYSTYPQRGLLGVFLPYLLLGKLAGGAEIHLQLTFLFHMFRIAGTALYIFAVHDFTALFLEKPALRRLAAVLAVFGGGLGWLLVIAGQRNLFGELPLDFYSPESFGFLAVFGLPHLAAGRALMLWGLAALLRDNRGQGLQPGLRAGFLWLAAGLFNPLAPALAMLVSGLHAVFLIVRLDRERRPAAVRMYGAAWLIPLPLVAYSAAAAVFDPFFRAWSAQNTIISPHPVHYLAAYALYIPWAIRGARRLISSGLAKDRLPVIWVLAVPLLVYLPLNLQRRLAEGVFAALLVLFLAGLDPGLSPAGSRLKWAGLIAAASATTLLLFSGATMTAWSPGAPAFRTTEEAAAFQFLSEEAPPGSVVLAPFEAGNALPAFAPVRVVIGHGPETIGLRSLRPRVEAFFAGNLTADQASALLEEQEVDFIFWQGPAPPVYPGLDLHYSAGEIAVYSRGP